MSTAVSEGRFYLFLEWDDRDAGAGLGKGTWMFTRKRFDHDEFDNLTVIADNASIDESVEKIPGMLIDISRRSSNRPGTPPLRCRHRLRYRDSGSHSYWSGQHLSRPGVESCVFDGFPPRLGAGKLFDHVAFADMPQRSLRGGLAVDGEFDWLSHVG